MHLSVYIIRGSTSRGGPHTRKKRSNSNTTGDLLFFSLSLPLLLSDPPQSAVRACVRLSSYRDKCSAASFSPPPRRLSQTATNPATVAATVTCARTHAGSEPQKVESNIEYPCTLYFQVLRASPVDQGYSANQTSPVKLIGQSENCRHLFIPLSLSCSVPSSHVGTVPCRLTST